MSFPVFQYSNIIIFQYFNIPIFQYSNILIFQYSNICGEHLPERSGKERQINGGKLTQINYLIQVGYQQTYKYNKHASMIVVFQPTWSYFLEKGNFSCQDSFCTSEVMTDLDWILKFVCNLWTKYEKSWGKVFKLVPRRADFEIQLFRSACSTWGVMQLVPAA